MSSFAIFTNKNADSISVEVHFNLWNQSYNENYLDIGIMLYKLNVSRTIYVWLPFKAELKEKHVNNLKTSLGDIDVINAIFNENYVLQRAGQSKWIYLKYQSTDVQAFKIYLLELQDIAIVAPDELGFNKNENISIAKINVVLDESDSIPVYLRFRIKLPESTEIIHEYNKPHHWIRGAFSKNYVIDFRYNDKRSFSAYDNEIINTSYCLSQTAKLHFLSKSGVKPLALAMGI